jgi:hypothetical protein
MQVASQQLVPAPHGAANPQEQLPPTHMSAVSSQGEWQAPQLSMSVIRSAVQQPDTSATQNWHDSSPSV